jgi:hypothetical protein
MKYVSMEQVCSCCEYADPVGVAEGCDLLILIFTRIAEEQDQKIAAFGSSYGGSSLLWGLWQAQKNGPKAVFLFTAIA